MLRLPVAGGNECRSTERLADVPAVMSLSDARCRGRRGPAIAISTVLSCLSNVRRRPILAPCRDAAVASSLPGPVYCVLWRYAAGAECLCDEVGSIRWALGQSALAAVDCDDAS